MTSYIEFVCIGNRGRSPVAELIGRNFLRERRLLGDVDTSSSGTIVDDINRGVVPSIKAMEPIVRTASQRGDVYNPSQAYKAEFLLGLLGAGKAPSAVDITICAELYGKALERFMHEELEHRAEALKRFKIKGAIKQTPTQTTARDDTMGVLGMETRIVDAVRSIYLADRASPIPDIYVLSELATETNGAQLINAFGKGRDAYMKIAEALVEQVPLAVDAVLRRH
jgi:hypothetical protein